MIYVKQEEEWWNSLKFESVSEEVLHSEKSQSEQSFYLEKVDCKLNKCYLWDGQSPCEVLLYCNSSLKIKWKHFGTKMQN